MSACYDAPSAVVSAAFGGDVSITGEQGVGGGCINETAILLLSNGKKAFIKRNRRAGLDLFEKEAAGLEALEEVDGGVRVPRVLGYGGEKSCAFLILEYLEPAGRRKDFWEIFGRELARLHRNGRNRTCGFHHDNYSGDTPQMNSQMLSWVYFFRENRLEYQLKLARNRGLVGPDLNRSVIKVLDRLDNLLVEPDEGMPSLLHGDLWGGNFIDGPEGTACIIDPAVYYGHRESDLAMTELFGGFDRRFYSAYKDEWPYDSQGYNERRDLYNLYHIINHLNLFGSSYEGSVRSIVNRYL